MELEPRKILIMETNKMAYMYQNILCNVGERTKESSMSGTYSTASMSPPRIEGVFAPAYLPAVWCP